MREARLSSEVTEHWLRRYGTHTASYVLTEGRARLFQTAAIDGFLGWESRYGCGLIGGDPVCAPEAAAALIATFQRCMRPRPVLAYAVTPAYCPAFRAVGFGAVPVGAEATFDPTRFTLGGGARAGLRAAVNHAEKAGLSVKELHHSDVGLMAELEAVSQTWLAGKGGDELGFLLGEPAFGRPTARRTFVACAAGGRVEGFVNCAPVLGRGGWYLDVTRRRPDAVRGAMELLTTTALRTFGAEGVTFASMGLSPLAGLDAPEAPPGDSPRLRHLMTQAFAAVRSPYDYRALARYKGKYAPDAWEVRYLCYSGRFAEWGMGLLLSRLIRRSEGAAAEGGA